MEDGHQEVAGRCHHALTALSTTRITLNDLPLMQSLWVRVRGIGIADAGAMKPGGTAPGGRASGYAFTTGMSAHSVV